MRYLYLFTAIFSILSSNFLFAQSQPKDLDTLDYSDKSPSGFPKKITSLVTGRDFYLVEGQVKMGSDKGDADEQPFYTVTIDPIYVCAIPASNSDYEKNPSAANHKIDRLATSEGYSKGEEDPATKVDFNGAQDYVSYVNTQSTDVLGGPAAYQLPTEPIWERAARDSSPTGSTIYPWGDSLTDADKKFYSKSAAKSVTSDIRGGKFSHMVGNVFCWCSEFYGKDYYKNQSAPSSGKTRSLRGGKWYAYDKSLRSADRWNSFPNTISDFIGVRICRTTEGITPQP